MSKKIKKIEDLKFDENNINKGSPFGTSLLHKSLQEVGAGRSVLADKNGVLIAGNKTIEAAGQLGITKIRVVETKGDEIVVVQRTDMDINSKAGASMKILDNPVSRHNYIENCEVAEAICEEYQLEPVAYGLDEKKSEVVEDDFDGKPPVNPITKLGDLYELNEHRVLCGDSTKAEEVEKLMNGQKADITFTSPPYNAGKTATEVKMNKNSKYEHDSDNRSSDDYLELLLSFTNISLSHSVYSFVNVQSISGNKTVLIDYLYKLKDVYADTLIWQKQTAQPAMAKNVLNSQFEYIHCFSEKANRSIGVKSFRGTLSNVIEIGKQTKNEFTNLNATFPVAFPFYFIENFSIQSCLDLFIGSGTTMVAAQQLNRKCYGMELDPSYCDVIIARVSKLINESGGSLVIKKNGKQLSDKEIQKYLDNVL